MRFVLLAALFGTWACTSKEPAPAKRSTPSGGIELIDPGNLPHKPLRYHLAKGAKTPLELAMDLDMQMGPRGGAMPTIVMQMEILCEDVLADGSAKIRTKIRSATARERKDSAIPTDVMNQQAALLVGLELTATLSSRGQLTDSKVDLTGKALPPSLASQLGQLNQSLEQVAMPLPEQAIGVGAKWRNRKSVEQNNVTMATVTTIELTAIEGDKVTFKSSSDVSGADQKIDLEGTPVSITKIGGGGSGGGVIDLARMVMAGDFKAEFRFEMAVQAKAEARDQTAPMKMNLSLRLQPLDAIEAAAPAGDSPEQVAEQPAAKPVEAPKKNKPRPKKPKPPAEPPAEPVEDPS